MLNCSSMTNRPDFHPAANLFPMFEEADLAKLANDIKKNGQEVPIVMHQGKILDGRNRWVACERARVTPKTVEWTPREDQSPVMWVISLNLHRRHLDASQRAMVAVETLPMLEEEAKARQKAAGREIGSLNLPSSGQNCPKLENPHTLAEQVSAEARLPISPPLVTPTFDEEQARKRRQAEDERRRNAQIIAEQKAREEASLKAMRARDAAAAALNVAPRYVQDAKAIKLAAPEVAERVKAGVITLTEAKPLAKMAEPKRAEVIAAVEKGTSVKEAVAAIEQKEAMEQTKASVNEGLFPVVVCEYRGKLNINRLATNAVIFMLTTPLQTADAINGIEEMGFEYRTNFAVMEGTRHRILIAAVKGYHKTPVLENGETVIERPAIYDAVQRMCPEGPYLDAANGNARGWIK
jgi:ParB-like chromosome segregation protein Spo0J